MTQPLTITLNAEKTVYAIHIERGSLQALLASMTAQKPRVAIVTDDTVWRLHGETLLDALSIKPLSVSVIPHGEISKNMDTLGQVLRDFIHGGLSRSDLVIAFGGGVVGDLAGFAAATYLRGVAFIQIPTTLLSMVDSSIGGKVAVDLPEGKNLVGAFYHPKAVVIAPAFLDSLEHRQLLDGIAEIAKAAYIMDAPLIDLLKDTFNPPKRQARFSEQSEEKQIFSGISQLPNLETILRRALSIKKNIVEMDEKESGVRKLLNFGHTLGHAFESQAGYNGVTHGEAVALGMQWITRCAEAAGLSESGTAQTVENDLVALGFVKAPPLDWQTLKPWVLRDKKMTGSGIDLVLIRQPGEGYVYSLSELDFDLFFEGSC